jgi:hypothetical protein
MFLRGDLACLLLMGMALFTASARAEGDKPPRTDCPTIYGRWSVTHVMDKYGNPQPVAKEMRWIGMLSEAHIGKEKAVLIWHGGKKKASYTRTYKFKQTEHEFDGLSKMGGSLNASVLINSEDYRESYPFDKCYLEILDFKNSGDVGSLRHNVLLVKLE